VSEDRLTQEEIAERADANYAWSWGMIAAERRGGEVRASGGMVLAASGMPMAMFNNAFVLSPLDEPRQQIERAAEFFDELRMPFCVRIREGLDPATERVCEDLGLPYSDTVPGMALTDMTLPDLRVQRLEIRTAQDEGTLADHRAVVSRNFNMPLDAVAEMLPASILDITDAELYVGYLEGRPVASSALFLTQRVAGIMNVATDHNVPGRRIGEALTWHCVRRGAEMGAIMANLQASEMGKGVYERMGFRVVSPYRTFHRPGV
jgi:hypothetical protein